MGGPWGFPGGHGPAQGIALIGTSQKQLADAPARCKNVLARSHKQTATHSLCWCKQKPLSSASEGMAGRLWGANKRASRGRGSVSDSGHTHTVADRAAACMWLN